MNKLDLHNDKTVVVNPPHSQVMELVRETTFGEGALSCPLCEYVATAEYDQQPQNDPLFQLPRSEEDVVKHLGAVLGQHFVISHADRVQFKKKMRRYFKHEATLPE